MLDTELEPIQIMHKIEPDVDSGFHTLVVTVRDPELLRNIYSQTEGHLCGLTEAIATLLAGSMDDKIIRDQLAAGLL